LRLGLVTYTNLTSGIGIFAHEFLQYLPVDSILSVNIPEKGQERWMDRQLSTKLPVRNDVVEQYLDTYRPDAVMFIETPFNDQLLWLAGKRGIKTVAICMHESWTLRQLRTSDLIICPCYEAKRKVELTGGNGKLLFLPISIKAFPFKQRTGHTFTQNLGFNEFNDRRQTAKLVKAFSLLEDPDARLILNSQGNWPKGTQILDPRIEYRYRNVSDPADNYSDGDISILPMAYEGYGRTVLESMASGMPTLTTNADPMNLFQHDTDFLIDPCSRQERSGRGIKNTVFNEVSVGALKKKLEWLLTIDTAAYSLKARRQAIAQSWESEDIDYRSVWIEALT